MDIEIEEDKVIIESGETTRYYPCESNTSDFGNPRISNSYLDRAIRKHLAHTLYFFAECALVILLWHKSQVYLGINLNTKRTINLSR